MRVLLLALAAALPSAASLLLSDVRDNGRQISFRFETRDTADLLPDRGGRSFFPLTFCLPPGARVTRAEVSSSDFPARLERGETGFVRSAYVTTLRFYPASSGNGVRQLARRGTGVLDYTAPQGLPPGGVAYYDSGPAEASLQRLIGNYAASARYRWAPRAPLRKALTQPFQNAKVKFFVRKDGVFSLSFEDLSGLGFPSSSVDPNTFRLYTAQGEVPIHVESSRKGRFSPGDRILFYGESLRGSGANYLPEHTLGRAYYLDWGGFPGLRAVLVSGLPKVREADGSIRFIDPFAFTEEGGGAIKPLTVFRRKVHLEEDLLILRLSSPGGLVSTDVSPEDLTASVGDYWQWMQMCKGVNAGEFFLDGAPALSGTATVRVAFQGVSKGTHTLTNLAVNGVPLNRDSASGAGSLSWTGQTQAVFVSELSSNVQKALHGGQDTLNVTLGGAGDCVFLNWIEVEYDAVPGLASEGVQRITLDSGAVPARGSYSLSVPQVASLPEVWDVSGRRFIDLSLSSGVLKFYDLLEGPTTYLVTTSVLKPDGLSVKSSSDFKQAGLGADLLIVVPRALLGAVSAYAEYKKREGLKVVVADAESLYDQFGDGSADPEAIKAFVKYAYENYNSPKPFYLLLIGDTSEGSDKHSPQRNLIPTFFIQVGGWGICSADSRFTLVSGDDLFPDLSVGRIPGQTSAQIEAALRKLMDYGDHSLHGPWKNDFLLIGGFEPIFTSANDRFQNFTLKDHFNIPRVDVDTLSPYFLGNNSPAEAQRLFDKGSLFASFYGHGGGSVWSDFSPSLMDNADAGRLTNAATLPIIYSLTCLTASFEAITFGASKDLWPPLGETMVLSPRGGGAAFYGASGHSSSQADYYLGLLLTQYSCDTLPRVGDIIFKAEQSLISTYGTDFFPVIGQYNLLGDPSLKIQRPKALGVVLRDSMIAAGDTLVAYLNSPVVQSGEGLAQVFQQGNLLFSVPFTLKAKKDTLRIPIKPGLRRMTDGLIRVSVWNASADEAGQVPFGVSEVTLSSVKALSAALGNAYTGRPPIGDTVALEAELLVPPGFTLDSVMAEWAADTGYANNVLLPGAQVIPMVRRDSGAGEARTYRTAQGIPIDLATFEAVRGLTYDIRIEFRDAGGAPSLKRQFFHLPIAASPDLSFPTANRTRLILAGGPVAATQFLNYGESDARPFEISQSVNGGAPTTFVLTQPLGPRQLREAQIPLSQTGFIRIRVSLDSRGEVLESNEGNNTAQSFFGAVAARFGLGDSLLLAPGGGLLIFPSHPNDTVEALAVVDNIDSLSAGGLPVFLKQNPYPLAHFQEFYAPRGSASLARRDLTVLGAAGASADSGRLTVKYFLTPDYFDTLHPQTVGFYAWDSAIGFWRWAGGAVDSTDSSVSFKTGLARRFAPGRKKDFEAPEIIASVDGRVLSYKDYIPLQTPIDVVIRDESGVDINSVRIWNAGGKEVDTNLYAKGFVSGTGNVHISFKPVERGADSLVIAAADINGNGPDTARFGYLLGDQLKIEKFANHPNPFGAKTTFAFTITDYADAVLDIYSVSGRPVRRFERKGIIGYQEIVWDARDGEGHKLSNGVYYLKVTVKNRSATLEKICKLAKAEGR